MLSRVLFQSKNVLHRMQPKPHVLSLSRHMSAERDELMENPPKVPVLVEEGSSPNVSDYDPKRESLEDFLNIRFGPEMATINDEKRPERDVKNFPRPVRAIWPDKTRLHIIPDSWFQFFYEKTGVTGPYVFGFGFITFLLSKEYYVLEHEFITGVSLFILTVAAVQKFGKPAREFLCRTVEEEADKWDDWQKGMIAFLNNMIDAELKIQNSSTDHKILFNAKRENVKLQLEAEFRRRQMVAYNEVRNRLDYCIAKQVAERQYKQQHMVNWIIQNVAKSITPQQESEALKKCLVDLKQLSAKHQITI